MSDTDELRTALRTVLTWTQAAMDDSKPNSDFYARAKSDRDWAERQLIELSKRRP